MAYRYNDKPPKPEDMLRRFDVRNGATMKASFGCFYFVPQPGHDPHYHDYINWPAPNYHGEPCQMKTPRDIDPRFPKPVLRTDGDLVPIHLADEGYTEAAVSFDDDDLAENLTATATIDTDEDHVVKLNVTTDFPTFKDKPIEIRFTVFVKKSSTGVKDAVCHGILVVLPGSPYPS